MTQDHGKSRRKNNKTEYVPIQNLVTNVRASNIGTGTLTSKKSKTIISTKNEKRKLEKRKQKQILNYDDCVTEDVLSAAMSKNLNKTEMGLK